MKVAGLIVAAGRGSRVGGDTPKQFQRVGARSVLEATLRNLLGQAALDMALVVIDPDDRQLYDASVAGVADRRLMPPVAGGAVRAASVRAGLEALVSRAPDVVLIHDGARPFTPGSVVDAVLAALRTAPAACPALPVVDALWREADGVAAEPVDRAGLWRAQTPQGFHYQAILAAHRGYEGDAADDVAVARAAGLHVRLVSGDEANYKITTAADLARARRDAARIERSAMDIRTGNGFDVHAFGPGDGVTLCGLRLPFDRGLVGHSDADVGLHALTDAVFGALAEGDIGRWFPPSDPQWRGASSAIFLRKAVERAAAAGFEVTHLDCTLVCEAPRIGPHADAMRAAVAAIVGVAVDRISVKATTSERLGFTGRGEGVAALATATLVRS